MVDYRDLYFQLFAAMADSVEAIEEREYGRAREKLIEAMRNAEEAVLAETEQKPVLIVLET